MHKKLVEALDIIGDIIGEKLEYRNGLIVSGDMFFYSLKHALSHFDKFEEVEDELRPNHLLSHVSRYYNSEPEYDYPSFEWTSIKHRFLTHENVDMVDPRTYRAKKGFWIETNFGSHYVKATNMIVLLSSVDGIETGCMITKSNGQPTILAPDKGYLRLMNPNGSRRVTINGSFTNKQVGMKKTNIGVVEMFDSIINYMLAGLIVTIKVVPRHEFTFAKAIAKKGEILSDPSIRINKKHPIDIVSENIMRFTTFDMKESVSEITKACRVMGRVIPAPIRDAIALYSNKPVGVDENTKKFIIGVLEDFYAISRAEITMLTERFGHKRLEYKPSTANATALRIARTLKSMSGVKEALSDLSSESVAMVIHEYMSIGRNLSDNKDRDGWCSFHGTNMLLDFKNDTLKFDDNANTKIGKIARWMMESIWSKPPSSTRKRATTFKPMFNSDKDAKMALREAMALNIAHCIGVPFIVSSYAYTQAGYRHMQKYMSSKAFNLLEFSVKIAGVATSIGANDVVIVSESEQEKYDNDRMVVMRERASDDVIVLSPTITMDRLNNNTHRLPEVYPTRYYAYVMTKIFMKITSVYEDIEQARSHMRNRDNIYMYIDEWIDTLID